MKSGLTRLVHVLPLGVAACVGLPESAGPANSGTLSVRLPGHILALWQPTVSTVHAFAEGRRIASDENLTLDTVSFEAPQAGGIDQLLLLGGRHARWAARRHDEFDWDDTGYVIAARVPQELPPRLAGITRPFHGFVDMLGPAEAAVPVGVARLYPAMGEMSRDESFVIGVPAPGSWTAIVNISGGCGSVLATCQAVLESELPAELPVVPVVDANPSVRFDLSRLPPSHRQPESVQYFATWPNGSSEQGEQVLAVLPHDAARYLALHGSHVAADAIWIWRPGWQLQRIDACDFRPLTRVIDRPVFPERRLRVTVRHADGSPVADASVAMLEESREVWPIAWLVGADSSITNLWGRGRTGPDGVAIGLGVPPRGGLSVRASSAGYRPSTAAVRFEDDQPVDIELVLEPD
jgi:hypothetical protein